MSALRIGNFLHVKRCGIGGYLQREPVMSDNDLNSKMTMIINWQLDAF